MYTARLPPTIRSDVIIYALVVLASAVFATPTTGYPAGITTPATTSPVLKLLATTVQNNSTTVSVAVQPIAKNAAPQTITTSNVPSQTILFQDNKGSKATTVPTTESSTDTTVPDFHSVDLQTAASDLRTTIEDNAFTEYPSTLDSQVLHFNRRRKTMSKLNTGGPESRNVTNCSDTENVCPVVTSSYLADLTEDTREPSSTASYTATDTVTFNVNQKRSSAEAVGTAEDTMVAESSTSNEVEMLMTALRGIGTAETTGTLAGADEGGTTPPAPPPTPRGRFSARIKAFVADSESTTRIVHDLTTSPRAETTRAIPIRPTPIVFTVKPTYMKFKKLTIVPSQPFRRDPKDNSWRDESISSLGIKFTPRHAKPFTFKPKSKTEFEALVQNTNASVSESTEPALRERLEKLSEMRKSKKKKLNEVVVGNTGGTVGENVYYRPAKENSNDTDALTKKLLAFHVQPSATQIAEFDMDYSEEADNTTGASLEADYETIRKEFNYTRNMVAINKALATPVVENVPNVQVYQAPADEEPAIPLSPYFEEFARSAASTTHSTTTTARTTTTTQEPTTPDEYGPEQLRVSDILNTIDSAGRFPADFPLLYNTSVVHSEGGPGRGAASSHAFLRQQYALIAEEDMAERRALSGFRRAGPERLRTRATPAPRSPLDTEYEEPGYRPDAEAEQMETQIWIGPFWSRR